MLAEADASGAEGSSVERGPGADARLVPICSYDEARPDGVAVGSNQAAVLRGSSSLPGLNVVYLLDDGLPAEADAEGGGAVEQELMEEAAADASAWGGGEGGLCTDRGAGAEEADSAEWGTFD